MFATRSELAAPSEFAAAPQTNARPDSATVSLGWLPALALTAALGIATCAAADALSRSTRSSSQVLFWTGLLVVFVPVAFRLTSSNSTRSERIGLVVLLGTALYLVKVMHSPFAFTFSDEFIHAHNANEIIRTHHLFHANSILPITPRYPGLESVTAALSTMTGISSFGAGLIVIGAARVVLMLALYLLFERMSGSDRVAALGAAVYTANSNFLFFSAQFSYESLALPLLVLAVACVAEREATGRDEPGRVGGRRADHERRRWAGPILLLIASVVVTHHLSSYALAMILIVLAASAALAHKRTGRRGPWIYAVFAVAAVVAWLLLVGRQTYGYLTPVVTRALNESLHTISGEVQPRRLFASAGSTYRVALLERVIGIASIILLAVAYPFGVRNAWRLHRRDPFAMVFVVGSAGFFGVIVLRFAPAAWETANRASEFLFIGLAFVIGLVGFERFRPRRAPRLGRSLAAVVMAVIFTGGVIAGWQPEARLSRPYAVAAGGHTIEPEGRALARWAEARLGPNRGFAASESDARLLLLYANASAVAGRNPDVRDILQMPKLPNWQPELLRQNGLRYVVVDLRTRSFDNTLGYYFGLQARTHNADTRLPSSIARKFDRIHANRIYESGTIIVYDMGPSYETSTPR